MKSIFTLLGFSALLLNPGPAVAAPLEVVHDEALGTFSVLRQGSGIALLTQNARPDFRPYLHPIMAPEHV